MFFAASAWWFFSSLTSEIPLASSGRACLEQHIWTNLRRGRFPWDIWVFPKMVVPPKWMVKIMENPIKMDDLGVPLFLETSISTPEEPNTEPENSPVFLKGKSSEPKPPFLGSMLVFGWDIFKAFFILCSLCILWPFTYSRTHPIDLGVKFFYPMSFFETSLKYIIPTFGLDIYGKCDIPEHME